MSLKSVNNILSILKAQGHWQEPPLQVLLKCWHEIVGNNIATHCRPVSVQRDVLRVATSSAAWSQNLTFERQNLLLKVNQKLATPIQDIHFSTAEWRNSPIISKKREVISPSEHPCFQKELLNSNCQVSSPSVSVNTAFEKWANTIKMRSNNLPHCPKCQCPTPPGELERWSVCALCSAKVK